MSYENRLRYPVYLIIAHFGPEQCENRHNFAN